MNNDFILKFTANLEGLVAPLQYDYKPEAGTRRVPTVIATMLPPKTSGHQEGETFPFVRWLIDEGEFHGLGKSPFSVSIQSGIYTAGSISDGLHDIYELTVALGQVVKDRAYSPYILENVAPFNIGNPEREYRGLHPHPYYYSEIRLRFVTSKNHK